MTLTDAADCQDNSESDVDGLHVEFSWQTEMFLWNHLLAFYNDRFVMIFSGEVGLTLREVMKHNRSVPDLQTGKRPTKIKRPRNVCDVTNLTA